jgi:hypothetical protein
VEGEEAVGLREGFGEGAGSEHHAFGAGPDPQGEVAGLYERERDQPVSSALTTFPSISSRTGESDGVAFVMQRRVAQPGRPRIGQVASLSG